MLKYLLRRILFFIPTLFVITLVAFVLSVKSPIDPLDSLSGILPDEPTSNYDYTEKLRQSKREELNLDLPVFYFQIASLAEPDTFYKFYNKSHAQALERLLAINGNWGRVENYHEELKKLFFLHNKLEIEKVHARKRRELIQSRVQSGVSITRSLLSFAKASEISERLYQLDTLYRASGFMKPLSRQLNEVRRSYAEMVGQKTAWKNYVPKIIFYGTANQYHKWISAILLRLDFGKSWQSGQSISQRIGEMFFWSFFFSFLSIVIAYFISIPLGILGAAWQNSRFDKVSTVTVFAMDSLPSFWVATLLLFAFANVDFINWFPATFNVEDAGAGRFVLPLIAYTYGMIAYTSRIMRMSMLEVISKDYIRTARAKGLSEWTVMIGHAVKNASLPIITGFAGVLPGLLGGHVILESIFSIPGMGREVFQACSVQDMPMVMAIFTLVGVLTIIGYLISDLLYTLVDPRIKLHKRS